MYVHECGDRTRQTKKNRWRDESLASAAAGASEPRMLKAIERGGTGRGLRGKRVRSPPKRAPPGTSSAPSPTPGGSSVGSNSGPFVTPKAASDLQDLRTFSFSLSLAPFPTWIWTCNRIAKVGSCSPGAPEAVPTQAPEADRAEEPRCSLCSLREAHTAAAWSRRVRNQTKRKRKEARYRLAPHRRLNPRCTPFFGGKGGGRGRRGAGGCRRGSGEGNYLRFNCRWRLRLFQDR